MADLLFIAPQRTDRPAYRFRERLDGDDFQLRLHYNSRVQRWTLDLRDDNGNALALGVPALTGVSLFEPWRGFVGWPAGQIFFADPSGADADAGRNDLRAEIRMVYRPAEDVAAAVGTDAEVF